MGDELVGAGHLPARRVICSMARDRGAENLSRVHGGMTKPLEDAAACADMQYGVLRVLK
jgi:hypothetical protein